MTTLSSVRCSISSRSAISMLRSFSSECAAAQKLRCVFEEYRQQHYSRETLSRFKKDLIKTLDANGQTSVDRLNQVLVNIGRRDQLLSDEELTTLLQEAGEKNGRCISTSHVLKLV